MDRIITIVRLFNASRVVNADQHSQSAHSDHDIFFLWLMGREKE